MENTEFKKWLEAEDACSEAIDWAATLDYDPARVYAECHRGDWLLWWAAEREIDRKVLVKAAVECAALALPYTTDQRVHDCITTTRRWCEGLATEEELIEAVRAVRAARAAAWAADTAQAASAAWAATAAARAAAEEAGAVRAAWAAADAAADAAWTEREDMQKRTADIVRQYITLDILTKGGSYE